MTGNGEGTGFLVDSSSSPFRQVRHGKVSAPYPQMKNYSFLIYLMILWSVGLLSSHWPLPSEDQAR